MARQGLTQPGGSGTSSALVAWASGTAYKAGQLVVNPYGQTVRRLADGTSSTNYDATAWEPVRLAAPGSRLSIADGRAVISTRTQGGEYGNGNGLMTSGRFQTAKGKHVATSACSDISLIYGDNLTNLTDIAINRDNNMTVKAAVEVNGVRLPVLWPGTGETGLIPRQGSVRSLPVPVDLAAGDIFYVYTYHGVPFGPSTTLAAAASIGDTVLSLAAKPKVWLGERITVDTGANEEFVQIDSVQGTTSPYTVTLTAPLTKAHASGVTIGQKGGGNTVYYDTDDAYAVGDLAWSGTVTTTGSVNTTTLAATATAGDVLLRLTAPIPLTSAQTLTVSGNVYTVINITGTSGNLVAWLSASTPVVAGGHTSGTTVSGGVRVGALMGPIAVVADRVNSVRKPCLVVVGDSLSALQAGYHGPAGNTWIKRAASPLGIPVINTAIGGDTMQLYASLANSRFRRSVWGLGDWLVFAYGNNDYSNGRTSAQMLADMVTVCAAAQKRGMKVMVMTLSPRTNSTDEWRSVANQTSVNAGFNTTRIAYNNALRNYVANGYPIDAIVDVADIAETSRDSGIWKVDLSVTGGMANTLDGIHPGTAMQQLWAAAVPTASLVSIT